MPIKIKIAESSREIDDALWLRHEVFVMEDGKFGGQPLHGHRLVDRFDALRDVYHVVAYDGSEPIAAMRLVKDTGAGMPVDDLFDFGEYRQQAETSFDVSEAELDDALAEPPQVRYGSAGMLAIRMNWRRRRDVIRSMFRMAATITRFNDVTHVLVVVNHETAGMYRRLGFTQLSEKYWNDEIGNHIIPLAGTSQRFLEWAHGHTPDTPLTPFQDSFTRWVYRAGEEVFQEGERGDHAYIVASGEIRISRRRGNGDTLTLAHLGRGSLFGELALIDELSRSATATATCDCELITLDRAAFLAQLKSRPALALQLFKVFARRIRSMDELAMVLAFSEPLQRLEFALQLARQQAEVDSNHQSELVFRGGPAELALIAAIDEPAAVDFLKARAAEGAVEFSSRHITFLR
ncbi:MAG: Crp/Fnr family transcriptional regulator [Gammaproteobacteria bacterium]|nr:Crp/Fnr family transcriptional regulator [Gammaproteobacteria bacterium]